MMFNFNFVPGSASGVEAFAGRAGLTASGSKLL
jgi:hypothetical protein